jgi:hypothetical protein
MSSPPTLTGGRQRNEWTKPDDTICTLPMSVAEARDWFERRYGGYSRLLEQACEPKVRRDVSPTRGGDVIATGDGGPTPAGRERGSDKLMDLVIKTTQGMIWQCPECFAILGKEMTPQLRALFGEVAGFNTCSACGASRSAAEVYGGRFDVSISGLRQVLGDEVVEKGANLLRVRLARETDPSRRAEVEEAISRMPHPDRVAWAFVLGFDRMPSRQEVEQVAACEPDLCDVTVSAGVLPGPPPKSGDELAALALTTARAHGRDKLHREVDLNKVTFQLVHGFLVIRIRQ